MTGTKPPPTGRAWWAAAGILAVVTISCLGIVWAGAANDGDGNPLIETPGAVIIGLLATVGSLGSAAIAKLGPAVSAIKENVQNDHKKADGTPLFLRDDLDDKHDMLISALMELRRDIGGLRQEARDDRRAAADRERATADHIDAIEDRLSAATNRIHTIEQKKDS